ncbi:MAG: hypothetical protein FWE57_04620 [Chitinispirillia bacterium]|nr:hypothetical protein [Chitinispirillia bacterium]
MRTSIIIVIALIVSTALTGCTDSSKKLQEGYQAEKSGDIAKAVKIYRGIINRSAPIVRFPDSKRGKVLAPELWKDKVQKYLTGVSEPSAKPNAAAVAALTGLERCMELRENDNSAQIHPPKPLDENAFNALFNSIFPPPAGGLAEWSGITSFVNQRNFSVLQISSPVNYTYELSVVSRTASRRVNYTLYPESKLELPLPAGDYSVILKSSVTFQKGKRWTSEYSTFALNIPPEPSLVAMNLRTRVVRKQ